MRDMEMTQRHETLGRIIDGRAVAHKLRADFRRRINALQSAHGVVPGIAVILVGDNPASTLYVRNKIGACGEAGIRSFEHRLPATIDTAAVVNLIRELNANPDVHGVLVQPPLLVASCI
jgi:methylenetetrahydrofolate dehydrogenase (NADP+)/methenyltetrahydrofolate cyclohydrolase